MLLSCSRVNENLPIQDNLCLVKKNGWYVIILLPSIFIKIKLSEKRKIEIKKITDSLCCFAVYHDKEKCSLLSITFTHLL